MVHIIAAIGIKYLNYHKANQFENVLQIWWITEVQI